MAIVRQVRAATPDDVDALAALSRASRARLAGWAPDWWRPAANADELHPLWLQHLVAADGPVVRVVVEGGVVLGCAVSMPQGPQWFVDDVAVVDDQRWADLGEDLLLAVRERPALTCVPTAHLARRAASLAAGLHHVSSYWVCRTVAGPGPRVGAVPDDLALPAPPPHTFGGLLDPGTPEALVIGGADGSVLVGSPSIPAPPVYDPGGTVTVVDRVVGDAPLLLQQALEVTAGREDVLLTVVCAVDDRRLRNALHDLDFARTVDVFTWS